MKSLDKIEISKSDNSVVVHSEPLFLTKRLQAQGKHIEARLALKSFIKSKLSKGYDLKPM